MARGINPLLQGASEISVAKSDILGSSLETAAAHPVRERGQ